MSPEIPLPPGVTGEHESDPHILDGAVALVQSLQADESPIFRAAKILRELDDEVGRHFGGRSRTAEDLEDYLRKFSSLRTEVESSAEQVASVAARMAEGDEDALSAMVTLKEKIESLNTEVAALASKTEDEICPALNRFAENIENAGALNSADDIRIHSKRLNSAISDLAQTVQQIKTECNR